MDKQQSICYLMEFQPYISEEADTQYKMFQDAGHTRPLKLLEWKSMRKFLKMINFMLSTKTMTTAFSSRLITE